MADETIILSVQVDDGNSEKKLLALKGALGELVTAQKSLEANYQNMTVQEYTNKMALNAQEQRKVRVEVNSVNSALQVQAKVALESSKADTNKTGSLKEMRLALKNALKAYSELSAEQRNSTAGKATEASLLAQKNAIKGVEEGYGTFTSNVGNYSNSVLDALGQFFPQLSGLKGAFGQLKEAQSAFAAITKTTTLATTANAAAAAAGTTANTGLGGSAIIAASGFDILKISLLTNPITLIAIALIGLITYLTQFDGAMDGLAQGWAGLTAAAKPVIEVFGNLGKMIFTIGEIYLKPLFVAFEAISSLLSGDFTGAIDAVTDGFDSMLDMFGKLATQTDEFTTSANGMVGAMVKSASAAMQLEKATQDLEDAQASLSFQTIKAEKEIEKLDKISQDRAKSKQERLAALNKAEIIATELAIKTQKITADAANIEMRNILKSAGYKASDWSADKKFSSARIAQLQEHMMKMAEQGKLQGDLAVHSENLNKAYTKQIESENALETVDLDSKVKSGKLRKAIEDETQAAISKTAAVNKTAIEQRIKDQKLLSDQIKKMQEIELAMADTVAEKQQAQQKIMFSQLQTELKEAGKNNQLKIALQAKYNDDIAAMNTEYALAQSAEFVERKQAEADQVKTQMDAEIQALQDHADQRNLVIQTSIATQQTTEMDAKTMELENEAIHLEALIQLQNQYGIDATQSQTNLVANQIAIRKTNLDNAEKIAAAEIATAKNVVKSLSSLVGILAGNSAEAAMFQKALGLTSIAIDTGVAIAGIVKIASTTSPDPITYGIQLSAGIASVLTNIANAVNLVSSVSAPPPPSFERGGMIYGPSHSSGGVNINAQGGEMVANRGAVRVAGPIIAALNDVGNGDSVAMSRIADLNSSAQMAQMLALVAAMPQPNLNVVELARVQTDTARVRETSRLAPTR